MATLAPVDPGPGGPAAAVHPRTCAQRGQETPAQRPDLRSGVPAARGALRALAVLNGYDAVLMADPRVPAGAGG